MTSDTPSPTRPRPDGRVTVIRGRTILAIAGALVFVFSPTTPLALAGVLLSRVGASLGFPVA